MLGWEGRFEPLVVGGKVVVLLPIRDLAPEERLLMTVALADGTELPFTVASREGWTDQQVNVWMNRESPGAVREALSDALAREQVLKEQNERLRNEEKSVDHALAALLAGGAIKQTPFVEAHKWRFHEGDSLMFVRVYAGRRKAAVVLDIKNLDSARSWKLTAARLVSTSGGESKAFALRMDQAEIAPGRSGSIAVVVDRSAFISGTGPENLALEVFRHDGLQQAYVVLDHRLARE